MTERVRLGSSDLDVGRVGFGCGPLGGHGWEGVRAPELERAVREALDGGINLFDTADCYGLGVSEERLGVALAGRRWNAVIATKFGVRVDANGQVFYDNSSEWLDIALDASLKRLGTDVIDLYQVHYWDGRTPLSDLFGYLEDKRKAGKIRWYGATNASLIETTTGDMPPGLASFSFECSLACREHEAVIRQHQELGLGFVAAAVLGQGVLSGKYKRDDQFGPGDRRRQKHYRNFHDRIVRNLEIVEVMKSVAGQECHRSLSQIAVRWVLDTFSDSVALVGVSKREHLSDLLGMPGWELKSDERLLLDCVSIAARE